jgi:RNA polymerase sigma-32 factor
MENPMLYSNSDQGFQRYLGAIERFEVLDRDRELELARRFHDGDTAAGDLLVSCSLRHVPHIAARYRGYGFRAADLVGEGNVGLLRALRRFEPDRGLRFMTYAAYWVRAHMLTFVLKHWSLVGIGTGPIQSKLFFRLKLEKARLATTLGEGADLTAHLARAFDCSEERIARMEQRIERRDVSLDTKLMREGPATLMDTLVAQGTDQEAAVWGQEFSDLVRERIATALERLDPRSRMIVERRLLATNKETLADIGRDLGISRERVRQLEHRVKRDLRQTFADLAPVDAPRMLQAA